MKHINNAKTTLTNIRPSDIQPNAVDLRIGRVLGIGAGQFEISENEKRHLQKNEIYPIDGWFELDPGCYEVIMLNEVEMGEGEAGWVITRSTLSRNGIFITGGLYDSGYKGVMAATLNLMRRMRIEQFTRIGQFLIFDAEMAHKYDGDYGTGKAHDSDVYGNTK